MLRALVVAAGLSLVGAAPADHVTRLAVPGAVNQYVSLASAGSVVAAVWAATPAHGETAIYAALSPDAGRTFGKPVRVATGADVGGEQPPRVVLTSGGESGAEVVVVWTAKTDEGTRLLTSRSRNRGVTFSPPAVVAGTTAPGNRGWESAVQLDNGGVGQGTALRQLAGALTAPMAGAVRETKALLRGAADRSLDDQRRLEREVQTRRFRELAALMR